MYNMTSSPFYFYDDSLTDDCLMGLPADRLLPTVPVSVPAVPLP